MPAPRPAFRPPPDPPAAPRALERPVKPPARAPLSTVDRIGRAQIIVVAIIALALPALLWSGLHAPRSTGDGLTRNHDALPSKIDDAAVRATLPTDDATRREDAGPTERPFTQNAAPENDQRPPEITTRQTARRPDAIPLPSGTPPASEPPTSPGGDPLHRGAGEREERVKRYGGTVNTEHAVEAGIIWLAAHQSSDGTWDRFLFERQCPSDDKCGGLAVTRTKHALHAGLTGLALLAFLGAGYTDRAGPYQKNVGAAVEALLRLQRPDGGFSAQPSMAGYNDSLATFALAEYYALTRNRALEQPLRRAVDHLISIQQPLGGWDYLPDSDSGRNDTSIAGWAVQALRAAAAAGVNVPREAFVRAALHIARATERDGRVWYADAGEGFGVTAEQTPVYRYGPAMTAVGLTCAPLLGWRLDAPIVRKQQALLLADAPNATAARGKDPDGLHSEYYWYYGTIAMFQAGGDEWDRWNGRLRDAILPLQDRRKATLEHKRHSYGSWTPYGQGWGKWGRMGSRVYTTAICTLTLEIYYRHTPAFLEEEPIVHAADWREYLRGAELRDKLLATRVLRDSRLEIGEPVLVEMLQDSEEKLQLAAATGLVFVDSPVGRDIIARAVPHLDEFERGIAREALSRLSALQQRDKADGTLRFFDSQSRLGTAELSHAYVGMQLRVRRDGKPASLLRVIQRFTNKNVAMVELVEGDPPTANLRLVEE